MKMIFSSSTSHHPPHTEAEDIQQRMDQFNQLPLLLRNLKDISKTLLADTTTDEIIEKLIKYDQSLAISALRIANSAMYGKRGKVLTLLEAVKTIGKDKIKSIYLNSLLDTHFSAIGEIDPLLREDLWKQSYTTARIASLIARTRRWVDADHAYALGLVHNIGAATVAFLQAKSVMELPSAFVLPQFDDCRNGPQGPMSSTEIGKRLAIRWSLPKVFQEVIAHHRRPENAADFKVEVQLVHLAYTLAKSLTRLSVVESDTISAQCKCLYITEEEWENYINQLDQVQTEANQIWSIFG